MTPDRVLEVPFAAGGSREGPLTLAQDNVLRVLRELRDAGDPYTMNLWLSAPVPHGTTFGRIETALRDLLETHEVLRTTYRAGAQTTQVAVAAGSLSCGVYEAGQRMRATAERLRWLMLGRHFEVDAELPIRVAVLTSEGTPVRLLAALSHLAADAAAVEVLADDLGELLRTGARPQRRFAARQPIDQAAAERDPAAQRRAEAALAFWRRALERGPQAMFSLPARPAGDAGEYRQARLRSPAIATAVGAIAAQTRTSRSTVLLAAVVALLGLRTANDACLLSMLAGNRVAPGLRRYVGPLAQDALLSVSLDVDGFHELVRQVWAASLAAYRHSQYDAAALRRVWSRVSEQHGTWYARDCVYNDLSTPMPAGPAEDPGLLRAAIAGALPRAELTWEPAESLPAAFIFYVHRLDTDAELSLWARTDQLPAADVEGFLLGVQRLLVVAAAGPVRLAGLASVTGLAAGARGPGWLRVGNSWVDPAAVRGLLLDVPGVRDAAVLAEPDAGTRHRLVAYLLSAGDMRTPRALHAACVAALPGRETAIAPHRYVLCASAPRDRDSAAEWRAQPVLADGNGRHPVL
jgi:hypothetical protein